MCSDVEYLNSRDATIMGSRNGHAPIYMWYTLTRKGYEGMRKDVERCLRNAHLLKARLAHVLCIRCAGLFGASISRQGGFLWQDVTAMSVVAHVSRMKPVQSLEIQASLFARHVSHCHTQLHCVRIRGYMC